jgi:Asp-tRNA(Asn)/Glu-tRNA(Gln) amidotransferase A subunit family amidase
MSRELNRLSASEAAALLASRELGAVELAEACLARIAEREAVVKAWAYLDPEQVLAQARACDAGQPQGLLHGVPVGIKDIIDTADMPTEYGSAIYAGNRPAWDAACVNAIRAAGGIIMGKTVTAELATSFQGKTANPHNPAHTPGGSSSGSAAAVADCMVPLALGTQTGGSTIRPASYCGVVGYKPSYGLIARNGVKQVSETLDTVGLMGRTVPDVALLAAAMTGRPALAKTRRERPPRIGVWRTYELAEAAPETVAALDDAARKLKDAGAALREAAMHKLFAELGDAQRDIQYFEMTQSLGFEMRRHRERISAMLRGQIEQGMRCTSELYDSKQAVAAECRALIDDVFGEFDMLLAPSAPGEAHVGIEGTGSAVFNRNWTLLRLPCVNVPASVGPHGLPVGVQVVGRYARDADTLAAAAWVQTVLAV